jgi:hypothetical protein
MTEMFEDLCDDDASTPHVNGEVVLRLEHDDLWRAVGPCLDVGGHGTLPEFVLLETYFFGVSVPKLLNRGFVMTDSLLR